MGKLKLLAASFAFALQLLPATSVHAAQALPPGQKPGQYVRWFYPSQMPYGAIEEGTSTVPEAPSSGAFLTLPFMGPHYVTSIFDHCYPNYAADGRICRWDGTVATKRVGGPDPGFTEGYAQTPGRLDYLYYDGHDGYDYGLYYEPVAAAADGIVKLAGWVDPGCHTCSSGLTVEITHGNGLLSYYGHLSQVNVHVGQWVPRGMVIGRSGMTGTATGPHLHFGVYYVDGRGPVDPFGWAGAGADPWSNDLGDLWLTGSPRYAQVPLPHLTINAAADLADPNLIHVSWSSPGAGNRYDLYYVTQDGTMSTWATGLGAGSADFRGKPSQTYWFWANVTTNLGWTDGNASPAVTISAVDHGSTNVQE